MGGGGKWEKGESRRAKTWAGGEVKETNERIKATFVVYLLCNH